MTMPTLEIGIALGYLPTDAGVVTTFVFTEITTYVRAWSVRRGKQHELDRYEAGTATLVLDNRDRRFDPTYTTSPYAPDIVPMRWIRIRAQVGGIWYQVFTGLVESWKPGYILGGDAITTVSLVDAFRLLSLRRITVAFASHASTVRVTQSCTNAGFNSYLVFGTGSTLVATDVTEVPALQTAQDAERSEGGALFASQDGRIYFYARSEIQGLARFNVTNSTWGDSGVELPYEKLSYSYDDTQIWNRITGRLRGTANSDQTVQDATSISNYLRRDLDLGDMLLTTAAELADRLNYILAKYRDPYSRVTGMDVNGEVAGGDWSELLGLDLHDRITVVRRPPGGGTISDDYHVENIRHDWVPGLWTSGFGLVPASLEQAWILGTSILASPGDTRLGY